jgi:hypothetical protein
MFVSQYRASPYSSRAKPGTQPLHSPDGKKLGGVDAANFGGPLVMSDIVTQLSGKVQSQPDEGEG